MPLRRKMRIRLMNGAAQCGDRGRRTARRLRKRAKTCRMVQTQAAQAPPGGGDAADDVQEGADGAQGGDAENAQPAFGGNRGGRPQDGAAPEWMDEGVQGAEREAAAESVSAGTIGSLLQEYATPVISVILLAFAFVFVIFYKRKSY